MLIHPQVTVTRFEQLKVGDLFHFTTDDWSCFAIKTQPWEAGDQNEMLVLGPGFPGGSKESCLMKWQPATVVSFGSDYAVILPTHPDAWRADRKDARTPVCLAVAGNDVYACTNGGISPQHYDGCYVHLKTGKILRRIESIVAFTTEWEIALPGMDGSPRTVLKLPIKIS